MSDIVGRRITDIYPETEAMFLFGMGLGREINYCTSGR